MINLVLSSTLPSRLHCPDYFEAKPRNIDLIHPEKVHSNV
jgi:hypothetical protein